MSNEQKLVFASLKADEVGRRLKSASGRHEVAAKVVATEDGEEYLSVRVWIGSAPATEGQGWSEPSAWSHTVYDDDHNIVASGFGTKERDSWAMVEKTLERKLSLAQSLARLDPEPDVEFFSQDDSGYKNWLLAHPKGFVLNVRSDLSRQGVTLHRATCTTITGTPTNGAHWTYEFVKVCASDIAPLNEWTEAKIGSNAGGACGRCFSD